MELCHWAADISTAFFAFKSEAANLKINLFST
jgi:hypothetical protein